MPQAEPTPSTRKTQRAALVVSTMTSFIGPFMGSSVNVALPSIGHDFALSAVLLGWVNMAFLIVSAPFSIPAGRLGDIHGRKRVYMVGVGVLTVASMAIALAGSGLSVIVWRGIQGVGAAMIFSTGMAILVAVYPPEQRGRVLGINVAAVYLGLSSGPFLGGMLTQYLGWRSIFWVNVPGGLLLLLLTITMLEGEWAEAKGASFDWIGTTILIAALAATLYAFSELPRREAFVLLAGGVLALSAFALFESRRKDPLVDMKLFRHNAIFAFSSLAALINYAATFAVTFLLSLYLQKIRALSPQQAGLVLVAQPLVQAILSPTAGKLADKYEPRTIASIGMALCALGVGMLNVVDVQTSFAYLLGCLVFLGLGFAFFSSPNTKAIMGAVERRDFGVASAVVGTMRQMGMSFSMGIVMMILNMHLGKEAIALHTAAPFVASMRSAFLVFVVMCAAGIFASIARGRTSENEFPSAPRGDR